MCRFRERLPQPCLLLQVNRHVPDAAERGGYGALCDELKLSCRSTARNRFRKAADHFHVFQWSNLLFPWR
jgi:hypothetical protein